MKEDLKNLPGIMSPMPFEHLLAAAEAAKANEPSEALKRSGYYPGDAAYKLAAENLAKYAPLKGEAAEFLGALGGAS